MQRRTVQGLNYLDNHDGVVTHLEPAILECEVKWALESITMNKASGGEEFLQSYFKSSMPFIIQLEHLEVLCSCTVEA